MRSFKTNESRDFMISAWAKSNQYYDFEDKITPRGVIRMMTFLEYDNLFALEVVYRMKELRRIK